MNGSRTARTITIIVLLSMIVALLGVIGWIIYWANQPNLTSGTVMPPPPIQALPEDQPLTTPFFSALIPPGYKIDDTSNPNTPDKLQVVVYGSGQDTTNIGFTSNLLPTDGIYGVADYKMRRTETSGYTLVPPDGFTGAEYVFRKSTEQPEMTAFVLNDNRYLSIAITGGTESLQAEQLQRILNSLVWKT